jgi:hypothetical protein
MITMAERVVKIETKVDNLEGALKSHTDEQREDFVTVNTGIKELGVKIDNQDSKYSSKWVEKAVISIIVGAAISLIVVLANLP